MRRDDRAVCGRYVQASSPELLAERFGVDEQQVDEHEPLYNVAPRTEVPVVRDREGRRYLTRVRWGLIPSWAKDAKIGDRMINARAETLATANSYKRAFEKHRCIIPADGFYEWKQVPAAGGAKPKKQPFFIHRRDGEPMALAGLWAAWKDPDEGEDADWTRTCVIITTAANAKLAPVHDRMPVILPPEAWDTWLDPENHDIDALAKLLVPAPDDVVEMYEVAPLVSNAKNEGPELVERAAPVEPESVQPQPVQQDSLISPDEA
jgi:putative SOS response-associated peptidase YedK